MTRTLFILLIAFQSRLLTAADEACDFACSSEKFVKATDTIKNTTGLISQEIDGIIALDAQAKDLATQIKDLEAQAQALQDAADNISNMDPNQQQQQPGSGSGGDAGGGGKGGGSQGQSEAPKMGDIPAFALPEQGEEPRVDFAQALGLNSGRSLSSGNFELNPFFPPAMEGLGTKPSLTPAGIASGNLPTLSGKSSTGSALARDNGVGSLMNQAGAGPLGGGMGMPGAGGGAAAANGGAAGGDSMASVGAIEPEEERVPIRVDTQQLGTAGSGGESSTSSAVAEAATELDDASVRAQIARGATVSAFPEGVSASENAGPGIFATAWFGQICADKANRPPVCEGKITKENQVAYLPEPDAEALPIPSPENIPAQRSLASSEPTPASEATREGLLGMVSGI